jgi:hypothetical protein
VTVPEIFARGLEALVDMTDAAFRFLINLSPHFRGFPPLGSEMQLGPRLGPSCDALVAFRFGDYTGSGAAKLLGQRS